MKFLETEHHGYFNENTSYKPNASLLSKLNDVQNLGIKLLIFPIVTNCSITMVHGNMQIS